MKLIQEAKRRLLVNIGTNLLALFVTSLVGIWLIPYLIRHLGVELYGMVPLALSISHYSGLFTIAITGTVGRFVALFIDRGEYEKANTYFSTAFFSLVSICMVLLAPAILVARWFSKLFRVPVGYESQTGILFFFIILSSFISVLCSPFIVSTFVKHRFDLSNLAKILSRILQVVILVVCFTFLSALLPYVGLAYIGMSIASFVLCMLLTRYLTPELHLRMGSFSSKALREMANMGIWILISQIGALLYLNIDMVIINLFLGPREVGYYAPFVQWVVLISFFGSAVGDVFAPVAFEYIAQNQIGILTEQTQRATKLLSLLMALPVGLLCGLSEPLLKRWLGPSFAQLYPLMWLLLGPMVINVSVRPMFAIRRGLNKVRIPAIVAIIGGVANLVLSVALVKYTKLGIYGVALATLFCLAVRNIFFTPIYCAAIMNKPLTTFIKEIVPGLLLAVLVSFAGFSLSRTYDLASIPSLVGVGILISVIYCLVCYWLVINKQERVFLLSLIWRKVEN